RVASVLGEQSGETETDLHATDSARHEALLARIRRPGDVALHVVEHDPGRWTIALAAPDFVGALAMVAGLLTAYRIGVDRADILTPRVVTSASQLATRRHPT